MSKTTALTEKHMNVPVIVTHLSDGGKLDGIARAVCDGKIMPDPANDKFQYMNTVLCTGCRINSEKSIGAEEMIFVLSVMNEEHRPVTKMEVTHALVSFGMGPGNSFDALDMHAIAVFASVATDFAAGNLIRKDSE